MWECVMVHEALHKLHGSYKWICFLNEFLMHINGFQHLFWRFKKDVYDGHFKPVWLKEEYG